MGKLLNLSLQSLSDDNVEQVDLTGDRYRRGTGKPRLRQTVAPPPPPLTCTNSRRWWQRQQHPCMGRGRAWGQQAWWSSTTEVGINVMRYQIWCVENVEWSCLQ